jgi:hypothetical protein
MRFIVCFCWAPRSHTHKTQGLAQGAAAGRGLGSDGSPEERSGGTADRRRLTHFAHPELGGDVADAGGDALVAARGERAPAAPPAAAGVDGDRAAPAPRHGCGTLARRVVWIGFGLWWWW